MPLIVIGGFAGLRHAEIQRLEWEDIDLEEGFIEIKAEKAKTKTRRIVPIKENLKAFLKPMAKKSGKVVTVKNTSKELGITAANTADKANGDRGAGMETQCAPAHLHFRPRGRVRGRFPRGG